MNFIVALAVLCPGVTRGDLNTPLSESSLDGNSYLLYKTVNSLFGLTGSNTLTSNQQLVNRYGMDNPGTLQANEMHVYTVSSIFSDMSFFTMFGNTTNNILAGPRNIPLYDPLATNLQAFMNRPLFENITYTGAVNFRMENNNGNNGGIFYSNFIDFTNLNKVGSGYTTFDRNINHFAYFDVTALVRQYFPNLGFDYTSAYLVGYEDRAYYDAQGGLHVDWDGDYNDGVFLIFNNLPVTPPPVDPPGGEEPPGSGGVPEPATLLLWTLGTLGALGYGHRRSRIKIQFA